MPAVGDVVEDMLWIREFLESSDLPLDRYPANEWPWSPGVPAAELDEFKALYPGVPGDVVAMFGVARKFLAGELNILLSDRQSQEGYQSNGVESATMQGEGYRGRAYRDPFSIDAFPVFLAQGAERRTLLVELCGENHGRVSLTRYNTHPMFYDSSPAVAWSVTDLIACTRELYEAGWSFELTKELNQDLDNPRHGKDGYHAWWLAEERERIDAVLPITDRWNCGDPTVAFEQWWPSVREPVPPVIRRLAEVTGVEMRSVADAVSVFGGRNPAEVASVLEAFWDSESERLGPGEQESVLNIMDGVGIPTARLLDADLAQLATGVTVSENEAWTRFVYGRALMRRRDQRRDPGDVDVLLELATNAFDDFVDNGSYLVWPTRMIDWFDVAAEEDDKRIAEAKALIERLIAGG